MLVDSIFEIFHGDQYLLISKSVLKQELGILNNWRILMFPQYLYFLIFISKILLHWENHFLPYSAKPSEYHWIPVLLLAFVAVSWLAHLCDTW